MPQVKVLFAGIIDAHSFNFIDHLNLFIIRVACHSCSPNTEISVWKVEGFDCLAMYSLKDLNVNDVITFDHSAEIEVLCLVS